MKGKKGFAEAQFHWVFILIVGTIILAFFISVVLKQKDVSEKKVAVTVVNDLETITTGAGISKGTSQLLSKPDFDLYYTCEYCLCKYVMAGTEKTMNNEIIFAPGKLTGRQIIAWTKDWNAPFRIVNFLFLTTPMTYYYLIHEGNPELALRVNQSLPTTIRREIIDRNDITKLPDKNFPVVKLVYLNAHMEPNSDFDWFEDWDLTENDLSAVEIIVTSTEDFESGTVKFYKPEDGKFVEDKGSEENGGVLDFIGEESIYAALFSHDYDIFACNMQKSFQKMSFICQIYKQRAETLQTVDCSHFYSQASDILSQLISSAESAAADVTSGFPDYESKKEDLYSYNKRLQTESCPPIY